MKTELSRDKQFHNMAFVCLTIYALTIFVYKDFSVPEIFGYCIIGIGILFCLIKSSFHIWMNRIGVAFLILVVFQSIEIYLSVISSNRTYIMYIPMFAVCFGVVVLSKPSDIAVRRTLSLWIFIAVFIASYIVVIRLFPTLYTNGIRLFLSEESKRMNAFAFDNGYGVFIGANSVLGDYIMAFVLFLITTKTVCDTHVKRNVKIWHMVIALLLTVAIFIEQRKSELFVTVLIISWIWVSRTGYYNKRRRVKNICIFFGIVVVGILVVVSAYNMGLLGRYGVFMNRIIANISGDTSIDVSSGRILLWKNAWELFKKNPVLGIGWGNFADYVPEYMKTLNADVMVVRNAHNCYLQLLCETGLVGFVLFVTLMVFIIGKTIKRTNQLKNRKASTESIIINFTCAAYQLFFAVLAFIDPVFYKIIFWLFFTISIILSNYAFSNPHIRSSELEGAAE